MKINTTIEKVSFEKVANKENINIVAAISDDIWREYFIPILGTDQVEYILTNFYSPKSLLENIKMHGYRYYLIKNGVNNVGFFGTKLQENDMLISNLYLCPKHRGLRIGRKAINLAQRIALRKGRKKISISIHKENLEGIIAAHRLGFIRTGEVSRKIGNSYAMMEITMELLKLKGSVTNDPQ